mgnify:CR=1 FL=1
MTTSIIVRGEVDRRSKTGVCRLASPERNCQPALGPVPQLWCSRSRACPPNAPSETLPTILLGSGEFSHGTGAPPNRQLRCKRRLPCFWMAGVFTRLRSFPKTWRTSFLAIPGDVMLPRRIQRETLSPLRGWEKCFKQSCKRRLPCFWMAGVFTRLRSFPKTWRTSFMADIVYPGGK